MNELTKTTNAIINCAANEVAPQIMTVCRAVTPQFYKGMSDLDVKAERMSIELLTSNIDQPCLAEMCKLAVMNYARCRSENPKAYFDINYILTFYKQAFNKLYCEQIEIPKEASYISGSYDEDTHILTEIYEMPNGERITVREIKERQENSSHTYSSRFHQRLFSDLDDIKF